MSDQRGKEGEEEIGGFTRFVYFLLGVAVFFLDQFVKSIVSGRLLPGKGFVVIRNVFHFTLVHNTGIAFGLLRNKVSLSFLFFVLGIIIFSSIFFRKDSYSWKGKVSISFIIAGALSNLFDRLRFGYVIDYLDFRIWPVFNLADTSITIGMALLVWELFKRKKAI